MVTKRLQEFNRNSEDATELAQEIKALKITKLHKASENTVNTLLSQVLHDVERLILVPIHA